MRLSAPLASPSIRDGAVAAARPSPGGRLLIVDDLADNREILSRRLKRHGFESVEAESGEEALRLLDEQEFDVVLLDVMMPGLDGNETLSRIRLKFAPAALPVIMVTAKSETRDIVKSLSCGANDYLTKPVDMEVALARVTIQVNARRARADLERSHEALRAANESIRAETARRAASDERIAYLAHFDTLTGMANRHSFDQRLQQALKASDESEICLLLLGLDRFKTVNDTLGHSAGDEVLKSVAGRIAAALGERATCARIGGDEFAVIQTGRDGGRSGAALAARLIEAVSGSHRVGSQQVFVGASVGIALTRPREQDAAALLRHADLAMFHAKAGGRGVYRVFEPEMAARVQRRRALELDLRDALQRGEFELHYQPVVDLGLRRVVGAEALLRWIHPARGLVSPAEFVPVAEDTGLIQPLGEWVLRRACRDAARWRRPMRVAVNLSPVQFLGPNLQDVVVSAIGGAGLSPQNLELEITESVMLDANSENVARLTQLRSLGVRIALDDFGAGYSGLGYFRTFRFDRVKIDQAFVRDMDRQPTSRAIIRAAINLCNSLSMSITAEGVETQAQLDWLAREGCSSIQGYFFSKPLRDGDLGPACEAIDARLAAKA